MHKTLVVARKETEELMRTKSTILIGLGFAFFFSLLNSLAVIKGKDSASAISLDVVNQRNGTLFEPNTLA